jgi:uncharacterized repeat protein (TIGR03987 family)
MLVPAIITVTLALLLYSASLLPIAVKGVLTKTRLLLLWAGLAADLAATALMSLLSPGFHFNYHTVIGFLALLLMGVLALLTTKLYRLRVQQVPKALRSFSGKAWLIWLIVFILGAVQR